jgi:hypothetical protein
MAEFKGAVATLPLGGARRERPTIGDGEQIQYEIDVPEGSHSLVVRVSDVADPGADIDVYVLDCSGDECRTAQSDSDPVGDEIVTVSNPSAGKWKVVIDGARVPSGSTTLSYLDVVFNPAFGAVTSADIMADREMGANWSAPVNTWIAGVMPAGRQPFAALAVQMEISGSKIGVGMVEVGR